MGKKLSNINIKFLRYNPFDTYDPIYRLDKRQLVLDFIKWSLRGNISTDAVNENTTLYQCSKNKLGEVISDYDVYYDDFRMHFKLKHNEEDYNFIKYTLIEIVKEWCWGGLFYFVVED
jgi:hypothetical protein